MLYLLASSLFPYPLNTWPSCTCSCFITPCIIHLNQPAHANCIWFPPTSNEVNYLLIPSCIYLSTLYLHLPYHSIKLMSGARCDWKQSSRCLSDVDNTVLYFFFLQLDWTPIPYIQKYFSLVIHQCASHSPHLLRHPSLFLSSHKQTGFFAFASFQSVSWGRFTPRLD